MPIHFKWTFIFFLFLQSTAYAEVVEVPEDELATESVLPVFNKTVVVRDRKVKTAGRFEVGGGAGLNLIEPLYNQLTFNFMATYHLDEIHGVNFMGYILGTELSSAGKDLKAGKGLSGPNANFDASKAPEVESMYFLNYQMAAYYGKINFAKQATMNISLYGLAGLGMVNWSDQGVLGLDVGIGQKFYFTDQLSLRADLVMTIYEGPDPTAPKTANRELSATGPNLDSDQFESMFYFRPLLTAAIAYIF